MTNAQPITSHLDSSSLRGWPAEFLNTMEILAIRSNLTSIIIQTRLLRPPRRLGVLAMTNAQPITSHLDSSSLRGLPAEFLNTMKILAIRSNLTSIIIQTRLLPPPRRLGVLVMTNAGSNYIPL